MAYSALYTCVLVSMLQGGSVGESDGEDTFASLGNCTSSPSPPPPESADSITIAVRTGAALRGHRLGYRLG